MAQKNQGLYQVSSPTSRSASEISRLLTAAVINSQFRQLLLTNPEKAISAGYRGESFHLGRAEKQHIASIRATSLADFASQCRMPESAALAGE